MYTYQIETKYDAWVYWVADEVSFNSWQAVLDKRSRGFIEYGQNDKTMRQRIAIYKRDTDKLVGRIEKESDLEEHSIILKGIENPNEFNRIKRRMILEDYEKRFNKMDLDKKVKKDTVSRIVEEVRQNVVDFHGKFENMNEDEQDAIINPEHYKMVPGKAYEKYPNGLEYIDLMEYMLGHHKGVEAHLVGQIFKYTMRLGKKDSKLQDAKKIEWYANRLVSVIEEKG